ncbi:MAG: Glu/Leu/Phe/Val dehydrogenase dimerization domain-containing protein [Longimicrobiales bacterium]|nr:Glu/Leu/Phe/Val dehydrogenase dimerization domain-containing protein [Longimicrobiales bacterium]
MTLGSFDGDPLRLLESWEGVGVVVRRDGPSGTWIFVVLDDDTLGPPTGGCRMKVYGSPAEALEDGLRLARGMTYKWAAMDFPFGGGKSVLAVPRPLEGEERRGLLLRFGELLNSLGGRYGTGADLGTDADDMRTIAEVTPYVIGVHGRDQGPMDPSPFTALGVHAGIGSALRHRFGSDTMEGRSILVEGVGAVGEPLARRLAASGAEVLVSDLDVDRAAEVARAVGGRVIEPAEVIGTECDVYSPCAIGATLSEKSIPQLRCEIVAGAANNQMARSSDAQLLHEREILYAPDFVINGGGAMAFTLIYQGESRVEELEARVRGIGDRLTMVFEEAARTGGTPWDAAHGLAERILERGPRSGKASSFEDMRDARRDGPAAR